MEEKITEDLILKLVDKYHIKLQEKRIDIYQLWNDAEITKQELVDGVWEDPMTIHEPTDIKGKFLKFPLTHQVSTTYCNMIKDHAEEVRELLIKFFKSIKYDSNDIEKLISDYNDPKLAKVTGYFFVLMSDASVIALRDGEIKGTVIYEKIKDQRLKCPETSIIGNYAILPIEKITEIRKLLTI